jgi:hypothetical protein
LAEGAVEADGVPVPAGPGDEPPLARAVVAAAVGEAGAAGDGLGVWFGPGEQASTASARTAKTMTARTTGRSTIAASVTCRRPKR